MTKHIDLLRAHQQKKSAADSDAATVQSTPVNNPYSLRATTNQVSPNEYGSMKEEIPNEATALEKQQPEQVISHQNTMEETLVSHSSIAESASQEDAPKAFNVTIWLLRISKRIIAIFQAAQQHKTSNVSAISEDLQVLLNQFETSGNMLDILELEISRNIKDICNTDSNINGLVQKSVMMMLYTLKVGLRLKLEHHELIQHTVAAMLHHIGMATIPVETRHKVEKLSEDELNLIKHSSHRTVEYLKSCQVNNEQILTTITQASERYDGSGSSGLKGREIAWSARMLGLLSMFEALIHFRHYRPRLLPRDAIRELVNHHKKSFDPVILKALIESISLYPVGTFVQLNTGEIGRVLTVQSKFPLRPIVQINMDKHGNIITKRIINLKKQPNLLITKCMYEENLAEYMQQ